MKKNVLLIFLILFSSSLFAQTQSKEDSLRAELAKLKNELSELQSDIDDLKLQSMNMDEKVNSAKAEAYVKKYGEKIGSQVAAKQIWVGMTEEMMIDSWGKPDKRDVNKEQWGTFSQWYYGNVAYFFKNGKLMEWEEKK